MTRRSYVLRQLHALTRHIVSVPRWLFVYTSSVYAPVAAIQLGGHSHLVSFPDGRLEPQVYSY